jgi:hypothetical protein
MKLLYAIILIIVGIILLFSKTWLGVFLIIGAIILPFIGDTKNDGKPLFNKQEFGMYNMNLHEYYYKNRHNNERNFLLHIFNYAIALAFQAREREFDYLFEDSIKQTNNKKFIEFMDSIKPELKKIIKISNKIDNSDANDMRVGESIGEYFDRKIKRNKKAMEIYNILNSKETEIKVSSFAS